MNPVDNAIAHLLSLDGGEMGLGLVTRTTASRAAARPGGVASGTASDWSSAWSSTGASPTGSVVKGSQPASAGSARGTNTLAAIGMFTEVTAGIATAASAARTARLAARVPAAEPPMIDGGSAFGGASVSTPWGKIAIGGVAGVVILGGIFYLLSQRNKSPAPAPAATA